MKTSTVSRTIPVYIVGRAEIDIGEIHCTQQSQWHHIWPVYSPGENFDSPEDNTSFQWELNLGSCVCVCETAAITDYSPGENFDSPQDNTSFCWHDQDGDKSERASQPQTGLNPKHTHPAHSIYILQSDTAEITSDVMRIRSTSSIDRYSS